MFLPDTLTPRRCPIKPVFFPPLLSHHLSAASLHLIYPLFRKIGKHRSKSLSMMFLSVDCLKSWAMTVPWRPDSVHVNLERPLPVMLSRAHFLCRDLKNLSFSQREEAVGNSCCGVLLLSGTRAEFGKWAMKKKIDVINNITDLTLSM